MFDLFVKMYVVYNRVRLIKYIVHSEMIQGECLTYIILSLRKMDQLYSL